MDEPAPYGRGSALVAARKRASQLVRVIAEHVAVRAGKQDEIEKYKAALLKCLRTTELPGYDSLAALADIQNITREALK